MIPMFSAVDFISFYLEIPVMVIMFLLWAILYRPAVSVQTPRTNRKLWLLDLVDLQTMDLDSDQYEDDGADKHNEELRERNCRTWRRIYYWLA